MLMGHKVQSDVNYGQSVNHKNFANSVSFGMFEIRKAYLIDLKLGVPRCKQLKASLLILKFSVSQFIESHNY